MEFCPTPLPGNRLLFVSTRTSACSGVSTADIYMTRHHPVHGWLPPGPLCAINSPAEEFSPSFVEADGATLLYFSSNRDGGLHKIYVSVLQPDGTWGTPSQVDELTRRGPSMPGPTSGRMGWRSSSTRRATPATRRHLHVDS